MKISAYQKTDGQKAVCFLNGAPLTGENAGAIQRARKIFSSSSRRCISSRPVL